MQVDLNDAIGIFLIKPISIPIFQKLSPRWLTVYWFIFMSVSGHGINTSNYQFRLHTHAYLDFQVMGLIQQSYSCLPGHQGWRGIRQRSICPCWYRRQSWSRCWARWVGWRASPIRFCSASYIFLLGIWVHCSPGRFGWCWSNSCGPGRVLLIGCSLILGRC